MSDPKILVWDIECTNLNADWGYVLSVAWKWYGEDKVWVKSIDTTGVYNDDRTNDVGVVKYFAAVMEGADAQVTWYGKRFDLPYMQARLVYHGLPPMPEVPHVDGWAIAKYKLKLSSNRLANLENFLGITGYKTPVGGKNWQKAAAGYPDAMAYVVEHNKKDVELTEMVYDRLKPFAPAIINRNMYRDVMNSEVLCPQCGSADVQQRGKIRTRIAVWQRYHCQQCGHWSKMPIPHDKDIKTTEILR